MNEVIVIKTMVQLSVRLRSVNAEIDNAGVVSQEKIIESCSRLLMF